MYILQRSIKLCLILYFVTMYYEKKKKIENNILNYAVIQITIQLRTLRKLLYFAIIIYLVRE